MSGKEMVESESIIIKAGYTYEKGKEPTGYFIVEGNLSKEEEQQWMNDINDPAIRVTLIATGKCKFIECNHNNVLVPQSSPTRSWETC